MGALVTSIGQAKIADAIANDADFEISRLVVGDGNGNPIVPAESMTELVHQVYDIQVSSVSRDPANPNIVIVEAIIPEPAGPFTIREIGYKDSTGAFVAVSDYPETQKFAAGSGFETSILIKTLLVISATANVTVVLQLTDYVPASRRIDTGPGLVGGGDLTVDRQHDLDWSTLLSSDAIANEDTLALRRATDGVHYATSVEDLLAPFATGEGITGGANVGTGEGNLVKGVSSGSLKIRRIRQGKGITVATKISETEDEVVINQADYGEELTPVSLNVASHKLVTASTQSPETELRVGGGLFMAMVFKVLGLMDTQTGNVAPGDKTKPWWHTDAGEFKRFNPITGAWTAFTEGQFALWLHRRLFGTAQVETVFADDDFFSFHDTSAGEGKKISGVAMRDQLRGGWQQYAAQTLVAAQTYFEFDLPTTFRDFLLVTTYTPTIPGRPYGPRMIGVYPTNALVDITGAFSGGDGVGIIPAHWWYSGDRSDLTGIIWRQKPQGSGQQFPIISGLTNRIAKIRFTSPRGDFAEWPTDTWQFAIGSTAKLYVR